MSQETQQTPKEWFKEQVQKYGCKNEELAMNYFTRLDNELKKASKKWGEVSVADFITKSIAYANIGIDPLAPKMLSFTLFKNKGTNLFDVVFVEDVRCMEVLARRYGINCPENITVELIYSNDEFTLIKKDVANNYDSYILKPVNPFDRGEIIGGVSLSEYANRVYNKVRLMSIAEIEKRVNTNSTFWTKWKAEMCEKTIGKNAWGKVVLDTTQLAEYYEANQQADFQPEDLQDLPFDPDAEL